MASQTNNVASRCVLCLSNQPVLWLCDWLGPTGCSGSSLFCPSAPGICPRICFTVDGQGTDPRRASPLNALALMSRMEILANNMPIKCSTVCQADKFTGRMVELWFDYRLLCFFILYRALWPWNWLLYSPGRSWQHILWLKICRIIFNSRNIDKTG